MSKKNKSKIKKGDGLKKLTSKEINALKPKCWVVPLLNFDK